MNKRMSGPVLLLLALVSSLILGDVLAQAAQDPQTQPTTPQPQTQPTKPQPTTKRKRGQVKKETTTGDQTAPAEPAAATEPTAPAQTTTPAQTQAAMTPTEQTDLSGTYAGTFTCDALGLTGDTTLTINGNQFSTADGKTGRIVASTTHGYTAVALQTGDVSTAPATGAAAAAATTPPMIVSMRARKSGNRLTLTAVPGSTNQCSFTSSRNVARNRRSRQKTPAATGTEVSMPNPAATPATQPAQPTTETPTTPTPSQTPSPEPSPTPVPTPSATPAPSPTPSGTPAPEPAPTASPSPTASPTPSPSPSPKPGRPRG